MIIPIEKIKVGDRIRKDFGDIKELAEDIEENGLINPPVINKEYVLLAGERRVKACKSLGWEQIEVRMMDTGDAEHELNIEISENEVRKDFSKSERAEYMKRLLRIEKAKAKERMLNPTENFPEGKGEARNKVADQFGMSGKQMEKEIAIVDNKDMFSLEEFASWNEDKLSTNKAYQMLKLRLEEAEQKLIEAEENPEVVEVTPKDYQEVKFKAKAFDRETQRLNQKLEEAYRERNKLQERIEELEKVTPEGLDTENLSQNVFYFCTMCNNFIGNVGGLVWLTDRVAEMPDKEKEMFLKAAASFKDWSLAFTDNLERRLNNERNHNTGTAELPY